MEPTQWNRNTVTRVFLVEVQSTPTNCIAYENSWPNAIYRSCNAYKHKWPNSKLR